MKSVLHWGTLILIAVVVNGLIVSKEKTLAEGHTILLQLAPVDPRSLIQGDYMILRYAIARDVPKPLNKKGRLVVSLNENNVATFIRIYAGEPLKANEHLLLYRNRGGLRLGAESFFFQEGKAKHFAGAKFGELKVDPSGASVLVGLRDDQFAPLGK